MQNFKVICKKCQNEMDVVNICKAFTDDPIEYVGDNYFYIVCDKCYIQEKIFIMIKDGVN